MDLGLSVPVSEGGRNRKYFSGQLSQMAFLVLLCAHFCTRSNDIGDFLDWKTALAFFFQVIQPFDSSNYGRKVWLYWTRHAHLWLCGSSLFQLRSRTVQTSTRHANHISAGQVYPHLTIGFNPKNTRNLVTFPMQQEPRRQPLIFGPRAPGYVIRRW